MWIELLLLNTFLYFFSLGLIYSFNEQPSKKAILLAWIPPYQLIVLLLITILIVLTALYGMYKLLSNLIKFK